MRKMLVRLVGTIIFLTAAHANAWDAWPCEVVLCLANPQGPTAAAACVPPIQRLWVEMSRPRFRMPMCQGQSYPDTSQYLRDIQRVVATHRNPTETDIGRGMTQTAVWTDIPASLANVQIVNEPFDPCEGGRTQVLAYDRDGEVTGAECRGPQLGWIPQDDGDALPVYEGYQQRRYSGMAFDVTIAGDLWQRVRPGISAAGAAGISYVGTATGGLQPRFGLPPVAATGNLPTFNNAALPANASAMRSEP